PEGDSILVVRAQGISRTGEWGHAQARARPKAVVGMILLVPPVIAAAALLDPEAAGELTHIALGAIFGRGSAAARQASVSPGPFPTVPGPSAAAQRCRYPPAPGSPLGPGWPGPPGQPHGPDPMSVDVGYWWRIPASPDPWGQCDDGEPAPLLLPTPPLPTPPPSAPPPPPPPALLPAPPLEAERAEAAPGEVVQQEEHRTEVDELWLAPPPDPVLTGRDEFSGDLLVLDAVVVDRATSRALWVKKVSRDAPGGKADLRRPAAVRSAVDELYSNEGWTWVGEEAEAGEEADEDDCTRVGVIDAKGLDPAQCWEHANARWDEGCFQDDAGSCTGLGHSYARGRGVPQNWHEANRLWGKACDLGSGEGCTELGSTYAGGRGVEQSWERANALYEQGCDLGDRSGCTELETSYAEGRGVEQSWERANELYERGCDGGDRSACTELGSRYADGRGVAQSFERANELQRRGCALGDGLSCYRLGTRYQLGQGVAGDDSRARSFHKRACDLGWKEACPPAK
ncbi:MAG TPA: tetratricopeptide repeat protein, partial [Anaeromyxobacter sp.]|nr:tetratricopeptide repeat protein [Anaeromyxobacter sp.]